MDFPKQHERILARNTCNANQNLRELEGEKQTD